MSLTLTLTAYVNEQSKDLISKMHFKPETSAYANKQVGVKSAMALQLLANTPIPQSGSSCGFNASGSTTFTQRNITTKAVKWEDSFCPRSLEAYWTQLLVTGGQDYSEADIPKQILDNVLATINEQCETADWQGDVDSGSAYLKMYDGILKIVDAVTTLSATPSTINATNIRTIARELVTLVPTAEKGSKDFVFFCGYDTFDIYMQKISTDNLYHMFEATEYGTVRIENSPYVFKAVHGLDGTNRIIGMNAKRNLFMGCDMLNEEESAKVWYSQDDDLIRYKFAMRRGWQIAYPAEVVEYTNS